MKRIATIAATVLLVAVPAAVVILETAPRIKFQ
jgi:hypothetical protein